MVRHGLCGALRLITHFVSEENRTKHQKNVDVAMCDRQRCGALETACFCGQSRPRRSNAGDRSLWQGNHITSYWCMSVDEFLGGITVSTGIETHSQSSASDAVMPNEVASGAGP